MLLLLRKSTLLLKQKLKLIMISAEMHYVKMLLDQLPIQLTGPRWIMSIPTLTISLKLLMKALVVIICSEDKTMPFGQFLKVLMKLSSMFSVLEVVVEEYVRYAIKLDKVATTITIRLVVQVDTLLLSSVYLLETNSISTMEEVEVQLATIEMNLVVWVE